MIHIEHVALWSDDIDRLAQFYVTHFRATAGAKYRNPGKGFESYFLTFERGARLELMKTTSLETVRAARGAQRMGLTHLAFATGSEAEVDALTSRLAQAGCEVIDPPHRTGDGYYESTVLDPDGNRLELTV